MCHSDLTFRDVLEPVGPLAPSVYWRRRCLALGLALLALVGFVAVIGALTGDDDAPVAADPRVAALSAPAPAPGSPGPIDVALPTGAGPSAPAALGVAPAADPAAALAAPPGGNGFPSLLPAGPSPLLAPIPPAPAPVTPAPAAPAPTTPAPAPAAREAPAPGTCADSDLAVTARTDRPRYDPGQNPVFSLVVTNTGTVPCVRDLDAAKQAVAVVRTPGDGLWGSNDCSPGDTDDVRTLAPGQEAVFSLRWSGRTSSPGCAGTRTVVPPGDYQLIARLDDIVSQPARFTLGG